MRMIVTAGPTREYLDDVRFLSNASSGRMGCAVAASAVAAGHDVTLLAGPGVAAPAGCEVVRFVSADDLRRELTGRFPDCDALVMTAAVGDFRPAARVAGKIPRAGGCVTVRLVPTEDVLASVAAGKRTGQLVVAFAVEPGGPDAAAAKARGEMARKHADLVVVNGPRAMEAEASLACVLDAGGVVLDWAERPKAELARQIVRLVEERVG